jgi:hypothetical protein
MMIRKKAEQTVNFEFLNNTEINSLEIINKHLKETFNYRIISKTENR